MIFFSFSQSQKLTSPSTSGLDAEDAESIEKKAKAAKAAERRSLEDEKKRDICFFCFFFPEG